MEGEEEASEDENAFNKASMAKRILIVLAGGLVNIVFGLIIYFALASFTGNYISNEVNSIVNNNLIQAGIQENDKILEVNNNKIRLNSDLKKALENTNGADVELLIERNGEKKEYTITPMEVVTKNIGIYFGKVGDELSAEIKAVFPNSPAEEAGLQAKDKIIKIDGKEVNDNPTEVVECIDKSEGEITILIDRKGKTEEIKVTPNVVITYLLGVEFKTAENTFTNNTKYGFWDTVGFSLSIVDNLKMLFTGNVRADQLVGPIGISEMVAETNGWNDFIYLLALISLSLGVTNLLPFPPLDGGKIIILLIEKIRKKPLGENIEYGIQMLGFAILILLSIYVAYNDILRIF